MDQPILLDSFEFDYLILGTGLLDSLFAACLSKAGKKVLVLDLDHSYSSSLQTQNLKEFISFISSENKEGFSKGLLGKRSFFKGFWYNESLFNKEEFIKDMKSFDYKSYNIDLQPKLLFSTSLSVDLMKEADMDKYMEFRAINSIYHYDNKEEKFLLAPSSKGQIFTHKDLSLLEKRALFKTLQAFINLFHSQKGIHVDPNSTAEFDKDIQLEKGFLDDYKAFQTDHCLKFLHTLKLQAKVQEILLYTLAGFEEHVEKAQITTEELFARMFKFIKSLGVHSDLPFLYTIYGTGDIPQAFSRIAAVYGSTFIINKAVRVQSIEKQEETGFFKIYSDIANNNKGFFTCKRVLVGVEYQETILEVVSKEFIKAFVERDLEKPIEILLRMVLIIKGDFFNGKEEAKEEEERLKLPLVYVVPPGNAFLNNKAPINMLIVGSNTYSCPKGQFLVYIKTVWEGLEGEERVYGDRMKEFFEKSLRKEESIWEFLFIGGYLQEKKEGNVLIKEDSGLFVVKNNDFCIDLDNYFREFVERIGTLLPEMKGKLEGFFIREKKEGEEQMESREEEGDKGEIDRLLEKLDNIVLKKEEDIKGE